MNSIFPNWHVKSLLGSGSYGKVYELERIEHGAVYRSAVKVISIPQDESEIKARLAEGEDPGSIRTYYDGVVRSLLNENRTMAKLKGNSNIVSYEDHQVVPHEDGIGCDIFIRMELLTSFIDFMAANQITEDTVIRLGIDICKALELCERKDIVHRDIKPGNIFVSDAGDFKLGDFGIARTIDKTTGGLSKKGTYRFMAPEVYRGDAYGRTVDICSLGLVMYYLMNGNRTPFLPQKTVDFNDEETALLRRMKGDVLPPPKYAGNGLTAIILKACSYDPAMRYQSATQMRADLERLRPGITHGPGVINAPGTGSIEPTIYDPDRGGKKKPRKKNMAMIAVAALAVVLIGICGAVALIGSSGDDTATGPEEGGNEAVSTLEDSNEGGSTTEGGITAVDTKGIKVLYTDIDWDSHTKNKNNKGYLDTDVIMRVHNGSSEDIVFMDISASYKKGAYLTDLEEGSDEDVITMTGYIPSGTTGIMIADLTAPAARKSEQLDVDSIVVEGAKTNPAITHYEVPTGHILEHDEEGDYYDVLITNRNSVAVNEKATLVAIIENNEDKKFEEADCTGRLSQSIPANETYKEEAAFVDPGFYEDYKDITVYAIDKEYYEEAQ